MEDRCRRRRRGCRHRNVVRTCDRRNETQVAMLRKLVAIAAGVVVAVRADIDRAVGWHVSVQRQDITLLVRCVHYQVLTCAPDIVRGPLDILTIEQSVQEREVGACQYALQFRARTRTASSMRSYSPARRSSSSRIGPKPMELCIRAVNVRIPQVVDESRNRHFVHPALRTAVLAFSAESEPALFTGAAVSQYCCSSSRMAARAVANPSPNARRASRLWPIVCGPPIESEREKLSSK